MSTTSIALSTAWPDSTAKRCAPASSRKPAMTRCATSFLLLCLSCLLNRPATAQPIKPLAPVVVQLLPGDVVGEPLIGLDSATYHAARTALSMVPVGDAVQANLRRQAELAGQQLAAAEDELRRCRAGAAVTTADYERMRQAAQVALASPPRPPLLLDSHFYQGTLAGTVAAVVLKLFIFH